MSSASYLLPVRGIIYVRFHLFALIRTLWLLCHFQLESAPKIKLFLRFGRLVFPSVVPFARCFVCEDVSEGIFWINFACRLFNF